VYSTYLLLPVNHIFMHRLLMEHFAAMTDDDIARLSAEIEARRC
jgi:hypothetical protein